MGQELYWHSEQLLRTLIRDGVQPYQPEGIPLHVQLTSPACEVLDVTLPTTIAAVSGAEELSGGIISISNRESRPPVTYHPTVIGVEFLEKIGTAVPMCSRRH